MKDHKYGDPEGLFTVACKCGVEFPAEDGKCSCGLSQGELKLNVDLMLDKIYRFHQADQDPRAIDVIFNTFWHLYKKFDLMNEILTKVDVDKLDEGLMVSLMVQTFRYAKQIPAHALFCNRVVVKLKEIGIPDEEVYELVANYRSTGDYWDNMRALGAPEWLTGPKPS